jgi:hypothetical protein
VFPGSYERGSYVSEDDILHRRRHENLKSFKAFTDWVATVMVSVAKVIGLLVSVKIVTEL